MFEVFALLFICTILAAGIENSAEKIEKDNKIARYSTSYSSILLFVLIGILIWFAGTRTRMNDTATYINSFRMKWLNGISELNRIDWSLGENPLFSVYQILLKTYISSDPQIFILISSAIVEFSMVFFLFRYSYDFGKSIYFFLTFTVYGFTMAAIKQTMATAIAIWIIPCIQEKKYWKMLFILAVGMLIHPYVVIIMIAMILYDKGVWNRYLYIFIIATLVIGMAFSTFTNVIFRITELIGQDYEENWDIASGGVGIARVMAYTIVPVISFVFRKEIEEKHNRFFDLCINMSIVAMCLSIISWFGGAVLFGRLPAYFGLFICIALPYVLHYANERYGNIVTILIFVAYLYYYTTYYNKFFVNYGIGMWDSVYYRISLLNLLMGEQ